MIGLIPIGLHDRYCVYTCHIHRNEHGQCLLRADSFKCSRDLGVLDKYTGFFPCRNCAACDNAFETRDNVR